MMMMMAMNLMNLDDDSVGEHRGHGPRHPVMIDWRCSPVHMTQTKHPKMPRA